jgi:hypothetical protein
MNVAVQVISQYREIHLAGRQHECCSTSVISITNYQLPFTIYQLPNYSSTTASNTINATAVKMIS